MSGQEICYAGSKGRLKDEGLGAGYHLGSGEGGGGGTVNGQVIATSCFCFHEKCIQVVGNKTI